MATALRPLVARRAVRVHPALLRPFGRERGGRRLLNIAVAVPAIVLTLPLMLGIAALIKLTSRGPVLFTQTRIGLDRRAVPHVQVPHDARGIRGRRSAGVGPA